MVDNVVSFPNWLQYNASPIDKLKEVLAYAERHPEDVKDLILIWKSEEGNRVCQVESSMTIPTFVYLLEQTKFDTLKKCEVIDN